MGLSLALVLLAAAAGVGRFPYDQGGGRGCPRWKWPRRSGTLLSDKCVQLLDPKGELLVEVWFRKAWPAKATEAQIKNGLTYAEIPETTLVGALRVVKQWTDYRKQKIKPGVYTLRIAHQPMDGDHMGTAPYSDFCLTFPPTATRSRIPWRSKRCMKSRRNQRIIILACFCCSPARKQRRSRSWSTRAMGTGF